MDKGIQIFKNEEFGQVRTVLFDNELYFVGEDVVKALGYDLTNKSYTEYIKKYVDEDSIILINKNSGVEWARVLDYKELGQRGGYIIDEYGLYDLVLDSPLPTAKKFRRWVTSEILPSIRKTGSYASKKKVDPTTKEKEIEARLKNAKVREANVLLKIASNPNLSKEYVQVLQSKATEIITGEAILPLPIAERKTYSAEEIGKQLGISGNKVGRMANKYNLKTDEYGKYYHDKSKYSSKEVESFRYYDSIIPVLRKLLELEE